MNIIIDLRPPNKRGTTVSHILPQGVPAAKRLKKLDSSTLIKE